MIVAKRFLLLVGVLAASPVSGRTTIRPAVSTLRHRSSFLPKNTPYTAAAVLDLRGGDEKVEATKEVANLLGQGDLVSDVLFYIWSAIQVGNGIVLGLFKDLTKTLYGSDVPDKDSVGFFMLESTGYHLLGTAATAALVVTGFQDLDLEKAIGFGAIPIVLFYVKATMGLVIPFEDVNKHLMWALFTVVVGGSAFTSVAGAEASGTTWFTPTVAGYTLAALNIGLGLWGTFAPVSYGKSPTGQEADDDKSKAIIRGVAGVKLSYGTLLACLMAGLEPLKALGYAYAQACVGSLLRAFVSGGESQSTELIYAAFGAIFAAYWGYYKKD